MRLPGQARPGAPFQTETPECRATDARGSLRARSKSLEDPRAHPRFPAAERAGPGWRTGGRLVIGPPGFRAGLEEAAALLRDGDSVACRATGRLKRVAEGVMCRPGTGQRWSNRNPRCSRRQGGPAVNANRREPRQSAQRRRRRERAREETGSALHLGSVCDLRDLRRDRRPAVGCAAEPALPPGSTGTFRSRLHHPVGLAGVVAGSYRGPSWRVPSRGGGGAGRGRAPDLRTARLSRARAARQKRSCRQRGGTSRATRRRSAVRA